MHKFYGALTIKEAGLMDDLGAARQGVGIGTRGINPITSPIKYMSGAYQGAKSGIMGREFNSQTANLQRQGVTFDKNEYGVPQSVNIGDSIKGFANNLFNKASNGISDGAESIQNQGMGNLLQSAGNFLNQYKMPLLGGAAAIGGGYLLKNLLFPARQRTRYSIPKPYGAGFMPPEYPGAFAKMGMFGMLPSPTQMPTAAANILTNGIDIPGISGEVKDQSLAQPQQQQQPYNPNFETNDPRLQKSLQDPRMRNYLKSLIQQVEMNKTDKPV